MRILTLCNQYYDLDHLPEEVDGMRFAILAREANYSFSAEKLDWIKIA